MQKRHRRMVRCRRVQLPARIAATQSRAARCPPTPVSCVMTPSFGPFPVPVCERASCMPISATGMTTGIASIPVLFAADARKERGPKRDSPLSPSRPERITALTWCTVAFDAAHLPARVPPPHRAARGATAAASDAASANSICINKVSCAFRIARLKGVKPSGRAHCNSNYATGNMLSRQGFPALQPLFESRLEMRLHPGCAIFSCISCTKYTAACINCCEKRPECLTGRAMGSGAISGIVMEWTHQNDARRSRYEPMHKLIGDALKNPAAKPRWADAKEPGCNRVFQALRIHAPPFSAVEYRLRLANKKARLRRAFSGKPNPKRLHFRPAYPSLAATGTRYSPRSPPARAHCAHRAR